jgi:hypothetical protein
MRASSRTSMTSRGMPDVYQMRFSNVARRFLVRADRPMRERLKESLARLRDDPNGTPSAASGSGLHYSFLASLDLSPSEPRAGRPPRLPPGRRRDRGRQHPAGRRGGILPPFPWRLEGGVPGCEDTTEARMKSMKRARRRAAHLRMKRKAKRLYPGQCPGKLANNLTPCSCAMCGNPRRFWRERTLQERRLLHSSTGPAVHPSRS